MLKNVSFLVMILVFIASLVCVAIFGIYPLGLKGASDSGAFVQGLDLAGGSVIVYEAQTDAPTEEEMNAVVTMLRNRLDSLNLTEATISRSGDKRVRVEIPDITDPEEAVSRLGATALLEFKDSDGNVVLSGSDVESAKAQYGTPNQNDIPQYFVELTFKDAAVEKFYQATLAASLKPSGSNYIEIALDNNTISQPGVQQAINNKSCIISGGNFNKDYADYLSGVISAGQLPFALKDVQLSATGPILGEQALETSLIAGVIGLSLVVLFMCIMYRMPGFIASIALMGYVAINLIIFIAFKVNITLPGIAGIVLSIGMAVDANVVIFERIKEEMRGGKSAKAALQAGYHRAITAVMDSNITTAMAALVLWYFGQGPILGFAQTMFVGVVVSLFSAITLTQSLLKSVVNLNLTSNKLFGI